MDLQVRFDVEAGRAVVRLSGELDAATVAHARGELAGLCSSGSPMVLDLAGLRFVDSAGLALLVEISRPGEPDGHVVVRRPTAIVQRAIAHAGLTAHLPLEPVEQA